jgi:hypothetical protein
MADKKDEKKAAEMAASMGETWVASKVLKTAVASADGSVY